MSSDGRPLAAPLPGSLSALITAELAAPVDEAPRALARELRRRHGDTVAAVVFYGSCLRRGTSEGVLDYYVLVDDYRDAYGSRGLALLNRWLPPNVLYCEYPHGDQTLRTKYAVMGVRDFARLAQGRSLDGRIWARFSQPAVLAWVRGEAEGRAVADAVAAATLTMLRWALAWQGRDEPDAPIDPHALWHRAFGETYGAELRSESAASVRALVDEAGERYVRVTRCGLAELALRKELRVTERDGHFEVESDLATRAGRLRQWWWRRRAGKAVAFCGLLKTAITFDDWVGYVLWKLERHSGRPIPVTERQRRHPFLFGWPVFFQILRQRVLR